MHVFALEPRRWWRRSARSTPPTYAPRVRRIVVLHPEPLQDAVDADRLRDGQRLRAAAYGKPRMISLSSRPA